VQGVPAGKPVSIQPAGGQFILAPAEVVAEFVQIGQPDLLAEDIDVLLGEIPQAFEIKEDLRRCRLVAR